MMRACATAMAVLLVVTSASAGARAALAQEPPTPLPRGPDARQLAPEVSRLANGLEIVLVPDHALPLISVQVWYRVGSADDEPNRPGLAHVARAHLEHRDDAPLRLLAAGVRLDSWTARDACWFASVMPATPEFLEFVLKIEAERMRPRAADAGAVDAALKAAAHDNSNPRDARGEALRRVLTALFAGHPYAEPPGCLAESLRSVTADELNAFRERWFVPGNATLLVVGDFQPPLAAELVRRHFAGLPWAEPPRRPEFPRLTSAAVRIQVPGERAELHMAWLTPAAGDRDNDAIDVLTRRLCNAVEGPLYRRILDAGFRPPTWGHAAFREAGVLVLRIEDGGGEEAARKGDAGAAPSSRPAAGESSAATPRTTAARLAEVERAVTEELARAAAEPPSEIQLNRARALAARRLMRASDSVAERAENLADAEVVGGDIFQAEYRLRRVQSLPAGDVQHAAELLRKTRCVIATTNPDRSSDEPTPGPPTANSGEPPLPRLTSTAFDSQELSAAEALRLLAQHAGDVPAMRSPGTTPALSVHDVQDGVRLTVCRVRGWPVVEVRTTARGLSESAARVRLQAGSEYHSADELRDYLTYHGLELDSHCDSGRAGLRGSGPPERAPQLLELQTALVRQPERPAAQHDELAGLRDVELLVVGDVDEAELFAFARQGWAGWRPADAAAGGPSEAEERAGPATATAEPKIDQAGHGLAGAESARAAARRWAQADRLVRLDSAAAIADALCAGVRDPWNVEGDLTTAELERLLSEIRRISPREAR